MHISLRLLAAGLFLLGGLHAQTPPAINDDEKAVSVEFSLYAWQGEVASLRYAPKRTVEALDSFERSSAHNYTGPSTLKFFSVTGKEPSSQGEPPPPAATVTFPQGVSKVTLITAPAGQGRYSMYAVPEEGADFSKQSIRLYNLAAFPLLVVYDDNARVELAPSSTATIKPAGAAVLIRIARMENGKWRNLFNNVAELNQDGRQNVLFAPTGQGMVRMVTLPPWPRTTAAAKQTQ